VEDSPARKEKRHMEIFWVLGLLVAWFALQKWVLPRMGVPT
jgi:hypothetical protein